MSQQQRIISAEELARHHGAQSDLPKWVALNGIVYDVTEFAKEHPGGARVLLNECGKDGTGAFGAVHPLDLAKRMLPERNTIGRFTAPPSSSVSSSSSGAGHNNQVQRSGPTPPPLSTMLNAFDFEAVAKEVLSEEAWGYYSSGADDEISLRENHAAFHRVWLKPRILVDVGRIDTSANIFPWIPTLRSTLPLYISATALGKLAHPEGEQAIVRASAKSNVVYMLPTLSSCTLDEMLEARAPNQVCFSQLYVNADRQRTEKYVREIESRGVKALFVTVDAPQLGRREKDMRNKFRAQGSDVQSGDDVNRDEGVTRAISSFIDPSLSWKDVQWLKSITKLPLFLKGVQCGEDAVLALLHGCAGVVLSNHGGRQLDASRSAIEVLAEVMPALRAQREYSKDSFAVYIDGGIRRGADIFKAVAMGATAVGIGRPCLYSLAAYGQPGIERMVRIFREELEMAMRLMGCPSIADIREAHVITRDLALHSTPAPRDNLSESTYEPLGTQASRVGFKRSTRQSQL